MYNFLLKALKNQQFVLWLQVIFALPPLQKMLQHQLCYFNAITSSKVCNFLICMRERVNATSFLTSFIIFVHWYTLQYCKKCIIGTGRLGGWAVGLKSCAWMIFIGNKDQVHLWVQLFQSSIQILFYLSVEF